LRVEVRQSNGLVHRGAVPPLFRVQLRYGIMEVSRNGQCAVRRLLNPFSPTIGCVLGHFFLPRSISYGLRYAFHSFGHGSVGWTSLSLASLGTLI
jgi:hypothetical protein